jgi:PAS domain S-box-containing protein
MSDSSDFQLDSVLDLESGVFRAIFESSADCVKILSVDGQIQSLNACGRALLAAADLSMLDGTMWSSLWDVQSHMAMQQALDVARGGGTGKFGGFRSIDAAHLQWWDAWIRPICDASGGVCALVAVSRDMTSVREAERLASQAGIAHAIAAEANAKLRAFFEQGANFAVLTRSDGAVLEVNHKAVDLSGFPMHEIIGRKLWECGWWNQSADVSAKVEAGLALAASGGHFRDELHYCTADGAERFVDLTLAPVVNDDGATLFVAATGTDITDRKLAAERLRQISADFSEADRRKTEFLVTLAHELRNPLAPISNGLDVMRLSADRPDVVVRVRTMMTRQVAQLSSLVDDLLDIARITSGKVDLKKLKVDLAGILAVAIETSAPLMEASGHTFTTTVSGEPMPLFADPTRVIQTVSNLLNNAAKYTPKGGAISLSAVREGDDAVISVVDNGIGIAAAQIDGVFTMFSQVGQSIDRSQGGLGIGLSLVRQLVGLHGGTVSARSAGLGKGSVFTIRLPLAMSDAPTAAPVQTEADAMAHDRLNVLVADDNADAAAAMSDLMSVLGHECSVASDGAQALEMAATLRPDVIFLDIGMPRLNGYEAAVAIRRTPGLDDTTLVALTGWGGADERAKSSAAGFDHHITKPASIDTLSAILDTIVAGRNRPAGSVFAD